jgi:phenylalanyl-tRNA synthetase beta chain
VKNKELVKFPSVRRDFALILDKNISFYEVKEVAKRTERKLLKDTNLFDVYEGDKIASDKKSYAVSFILQDAEKTLTDQEVDKTMEKLLKAFEKELGASLRA